MAGRLSNSIGIAGSSHFDNVSKSRTDPLTVFGPAESSITLSKGGARGGVASNVAVKLPVWSANGVLTQMLMAGVVTHRAVPYFSAPDRSCWRRS